MVPIKDFINYINYNINMEFKDILRDLRLEKGLTQEQLAKDINFSMSIVNKWENGKKKPNFKALKILAKYFNVSANRLLGLEDINRI